jgi:hypothetical protein
MLLLKEAYVEVVDMQDDYAKVDGYINQMILSKKFY